MEILVRLVALLPIGYKICWYCGALCAMDGQVGQATSFEGSSCGRVHHPSQYAHTIVHAVPQSPKKLRAGSALSGALLAQQRQERENGVSYGKPAKLYGGRAERKKVEAAVE